MPDISLRLCKDMLVLSSPVEPVLARQGFGGHPDLEYVNIVEPEAVQDIFRLNKLAGVHCLITNTGGITPAQLLHYGLEGREQEIISAALQNVNSVKPQHVLFEIGPCGLPLDASSKASLNESRDQYVRIARICQDFAFDAYFLNDFTNIADLKCALMGIRQISDRPVIASVHLEEGGMLIGGRHSFEDALGAMVDLEASVIGFSTGAPLETAVDLTRRACGTSLPVLVQLVVNPAKTKRELLLGDTPYSCPDVLVEAGLELHRAGAQFLRAVGLATPAYAGALVAACDGLDVISSSVEV